MALFVFINTTEAVGPVWLIYSLICLFQLSRITKKKCFQFNVMFGVHWLTNLKSLFVTRRSIIRYFDCRCSCNCSYNLWPLTQILTLAFSDRTNEALKRTKDSVDFLFRRSHNGKAKLRWSFVLLHRTPLAFHCLDKVLFK